MQDVGNVLLQSHLLLALKKQKEAVLNLVDYTSKLIGKPENSATISKMFSLILRMAGNYKLTDLPEVQGFVNKMIKSQRE